MNPLARLASLKLKLGLVIVLAIFVTLGTLLVSAKLGLRLRWGALVALVLSLASVQLFARGMIAPLRAMARAADAMARGDHGQRVPVSSRDEVGQLAASFNHMAAELETLDRQRQDLVADAAHELRTPLSALRAALENAVDGVEEPEMPALLAQVERLSRTADQLLDLSRLEAGATALVPREVELRTLLGEPSATIDVPAGLTVRGDPDRLAQVVANLLDNAARHAPGAPVHVRARARPAGGVTLEVEDHGNGLDPGDEQRIFDRFARADRARSVPGAGLGLAIVRSIVELHGGAIRAERVSPHGCRMVVELP